MTKVAQAFGVAALLTLAAAVAGRFIGDPYALVGSGILSWILLSSNLALIGILAALLAAKDK
jgi:hypothetical protein